MVKPIDILGNIEVQKVTTTLRAFGWEVSAVALTDDVITVRAKKRIVEFSPEIRRDTVTPMPDEEVA